MPTKKTTNKTTTTAAQELLDEVAILKAQRTSLLKRLGGLRYHIMTESANGNDLGPTDFVRLVDSIIEEA